MMAGYGTLIVAFSDSVKVLDSMFSDTPAWGTDPFKSWAEGYENTRTTPISGHTVVTTSEYNMPYAKERLMQYTAIAKMREF